MDNRTPLLGKRVAILADDGFEQAELEEPRKALKAAGAETVEIKVNLPLARTKPRWSS